MKNINNTSKILVALTTGLLLQSAAMATPRGIQTVTSAQAQTLSGAVVVKKPTFDLDVKCTLEFTAIVADLRTKVSTDIPANYPINLEVSNNVADIVNNGLQQGTAPCVVKNDVVSALNTAGIMPLMMSESQLLTASAITAGRNAAPLTDASLKSSGSQTLSAMAEGGDFQFTSDTEIAVPSGGNGYVYSSATKKMLRALTSDLMNYTDFLTLKIKLSNGGTGSTGPVSIDSHATTGEAGMPVSLMNN